MVPPPQTEVPFEKPLGRQLARAVVGAGGLGILQRVLVVTTSVLLARMLGTNGFGLFSYVAAFVALLSVPAQFGIPMLILRSVAAYSATARWDLVRGLLVRAVQYGVVLALSVAFVAIALVGSLKTSLPSLDWATFLLGVLLLPTGTITAMATSALSGLGYVVRAQVAEQLLRPLLMALALGAIVLVTHWSLAPAEAMAVNVIAAAIASVFSVSLLAKIAAPKLRHVHSSFASGEWLKSVAPFGLIAVMQIVNTQSDVLLLGLFSTPSDVGLYRAASQAAGLIAFTLTTVNTVIGPRLAWLYKTGDQRSLQRLVTMSSRLILVTSLPVALGFIFFGDPLLRLIFGREFGGGSTALAILSVGQVVNASVGSVGLMLIMTGHERDALLGLSVAAVLNLLLDLLLIPALGMIGAAYATAVSVITWNVLLAFKLYSTTGLVSMAFSFRRGLPTHSP